MAALILVGARWRPALPFSLIGVALATAAASILPLGLTPLGELPAGLPVRRRNARAHNFMDNVGITPAVQGLCLSILSWGRP